MSNSKKFFAAVVAGVTLFTMAGNAGAQSTTDLQAQIAALLAQIAQLQTQLNTGTSGTGTTYNFTRDLTVGSKGADVQALQQFLNGQGFKIAATGAGSPGNESTYFGTLTKAALKKWQAANGVLSTGYFGPLTRAKIASMGTGTGGTGGTGGTTGTGIAVTVATSNPASTTLTKSSVGTTVLAFNVTANSADATLNSVKFTRTGVGLNTDYSNVYIYDGATRLKNGKSIASDTNTVEFTALGVSIPKGTTKTFYVKADVYSSATASDINTISIAKAADISFSGGTVTGTFPISGNAMTIGSQSIGSVTIANGASVSKPTLGSTGAKLGTIKFTAGSDNIEINALTLVQNGSFSNTNISNLVLKYAGSPVATASSMTGDKAVFTFATPYAITKNQNRTFDLYGDLSGGKTTDTIRFYLEESTDLSVMDMQYGQNASVTNSFGSTTAYCTGAASNTCDTAGSLQGGTITLSDQGPIAQTIRNNSTGNDLFKFNLTSTRNVTFKDYYVTLTQTAWDGTSAKQGGDAATDLDAGAISTAGAVTFQTDGDDNDLAVGDIVSLVMDTVTAGTAGTYYARLTTVPTDTSATNVEGVLVAKTISGATTYVSTLSAQVTWDDDAGTNNMTEVLDNHLRTYVKNLKLVDLDSGNTLASVSTSDAFVAFTDDFDMTSGQTRHFAVRADFDQSLAAANAFKTGVDFTQASTIKDVDANQYLTSSDVVAGSTTGKIMTVGTASLTVVRASTPVSQTVIKGGTPDILGVSVTAGASGAVKLTEMTVRFYGDDDGTFDNGEGDTAANSLVDTVSLYKDDGTLLAGPKALSLVGTIGSDGGYYKATFDGMAYDIAAGAAKKLLVRATLKNTPSATRYLAANLDPASDVTVQDADGNVLTLTADTDGGINEDDTTATVGDDTTPVVIFTINTTGTLTPTVEGSPAAGLVVAGATNVLMAKYKFNAVTDGYTIDKMSIIYDASGAFGTVADTYDRDIVRVGVRYTKADGTVETVWGNMSSGKADLSGLNITVPKDTNNTYVEVLADLNTISNGAVSGDAPRLGISEVQATTNTFNATGIGSSETKDYTATSGIAGTGNVYAMTLRKSVPTVAKAGTAGSLVNGENNLFSFTVAADSHGAVALRRVALTSSYTTGINVSDLRFLRGASDITSSVSIRNMVGANLKTGGSNLATAGGTATSDIVYVTWDKASTDEEPVTAGSSNTYYLKATVSSAAAGDSFSMYIADDTAAGTTTATGAGVATLRTSTASGGESAAASTNNTRVIWRWASATTAYVDVNGSGDYEAASDFLVVTFGTGDTGYTVDEIIPGVLRFLDGAGDGTGDSTAYFDVNGDGAYVLADDVGISLTKSVTSVPSDNAVMAYDLRYTTGGGTTLYFDEMDAGTDNTYNANDDSIIVAAGVTDPGTAPSNNAEVYTANANLIWSDESNTSHTTATTDWFNGYLVSDLATASYTLSL